MITPAIRYISSFQDATNSSSIPVPTPVMVDGRIWDQKNLNVSSYRSGRVIPQVKTGWSALTTGAWRYYNDNPASAAVYGRLYNWYALMGIYDAASLADPSLRDNIAPIDWEVATYGEWITLRNILGRNTAAIALKESGPAHWGPTNTATNSSFFTALPGGYKLGSNNSVFNELGSSGKWWPKNADGHFYLSNTSNALGYYSPALKNRGQSIRLIKPTGTIPDFTTTYPTTITSTSLLGTGGYIPTSYSGIIIERGIVYGTSINPTVANTKIQDVTGGTGSYTINITTPPLSTNTQYYIRAYAIDNVVGAVYANNISVFTLDSSPTLFTNITSRITTNSAESGGTIENDGGLAITAKGVVWSTSPNPTIALPTKTSNGSGSGEFYSDITGLVLNTKYYVRAYATNSGATGYGQQEEFTTLAIPSLNLIFNQYIAYHAYSLRRLSNTYDYRCVRVRRTNLTPNTLSTTVDVFFNSYNEIGLYSDIRYVSGATTLATNLGEFAASIVNGYENVDGVNINQNIFVVTWYDQSGNGKNVTQTNLGSQPRLVNAGNLEIVDGTTGIRFIAANSNYLDLTDTSTSYNDMSCYAVGNSLSATANTSIYGQGHLGLNARLFLPQGTSIAYETNNTFPISGITANVDRLYEIICSASTTSAYSNGIQSSVTSVPSLSVTNRFIRIGANGSPFVHMNGHVKEVICLVGTPDRIGIESNIMDHYGIQKIPLIITDDVNYIEPTGTAIGGGNLIDTFGITPTMRGVCWNTLPEPALGFGAATNNGQGIGAFTSNLTFLAAYTTYYARAYAVNSIGIAYGQEKQFTTSNSTPMNLILDLYPSAYHAYSLRRLKSIYTGVCLRVRRTTSIPSVTTTTVDLYFDASSAVSLNSEITYVSGTVTTAMRLGEFCAAPGFINADGYNPCEIFVSTWFDQSGNNKNVINATLSQQPRLVRLDTGVATLETSGGKVAVRFISASLQRLTLTDASVPLNNVSSYALGNSLATSNNAVLSMGDTTNANLFWLPQGSNIAYRNVSVWAHGNIANQPRLYELICGSSVVNAYANGNILTPTTPQTPMTGNNQAVRIGSYSSITMNGYVTEVISFVGTSNRTQIESNINTYYNVW